MSRTPPLNEALSKRKLFDCHDSVAAYPLKPIDDRRMRTRLYRGVAGRDREVPPMPRSLLCLCTFDPIAIASSLLNLARA